MPSINVSESVCYKERQGSKFQEVRSERKDKKLTYSQY